MEQNTNIVKEVAEFIPEKNRLVDSLIEQHLLHEYLAGNIGESELINRLDESNISRATSAAPDLSRSNINAVIRDKASTIRTSMDRATSKIGDSIREINGSICTVPSSLGDPRLSTAIENIVVSTGCGCINPDDTIDIKCVPFSDVDAFSKLVQDTSDGEAEYLALIPIYDALISGEKLNYKTVNAHAIFTTFITMFQSGRVICTADHMSANYILVAHMFTLLGECKKSTDDSKWRTGITLDDIGDLAKGDPLWEITLGNYVPERDDNKVKDTISAINSSVGDKEFQIESHQLPRGDFETYVMAVIDCHHSSNECDKAYFAHILSMIGEWAARDMSATDDSLAYILGNKNIGNLAERIHIARLRYNEKYSGIFAPTKYLDFFTNNRYLTRSADVIKNATFILGAYGAVEGISYPGLKDDFYWHHLSTDALSKVDNKVNVVGDLLVLSLVGELISIDKTNTAAPDSPRPVYAELRRTTCVLADKFIEDNFEWAADILNYRENKVVYPYRIHPDKRIALSMRRITLRRMVNLLLEELNTAK